MFITGEKTARREEIVVDTGGRGGTGKSRVPGESGRRRCWRKQVEGALEGRSLVPPSRTGGGGREGGSPVCRWQGKGAGS